MNVRMEKNKQANEIDGKFDTFAAAFGFSIHIKVGHNSTSLTRILLLSWAFERME